MGAYNLKQVILDFNNDRMDVERAMGHSLQHIGLLYDGQTAARSERRELRKNVTVLQTDVKRVQADVRRLQKRQPEVDRLESLENILTALDVTVANLKADVDSLNHRLSNAGAGDPSAKN